LEETNMSSVREKLCRVLVVGVGLVTLLSALGAVGALKLCEGYPTNNRLLYDVAGMEGVKWSFAFPAFLLVGIAILALILVALSVIDTDRERDSLQVLTVSAIWILTVVLIVAFGLVGWSVPAG
jgi:hypothetical protein